MTDAEFITAGLTAVNTIVIAVMWITDRRRFESLEKSIKEGFDKNETKISEIHKDIMDIRERLAFLEASNIYTMPIETISPNPRSTAMKQNWVMRRKKQLAKKGESK